MTQTTGTNTKQNVNTSFKFQSNFLKCYYIFFKAPLAKCFELRQIKEKSLAMMNDNEGSGQPVLVHRLTRTFNARSLKVYFTRHIQILIKMKLQWLILRSVIRIWVQVQISLNLTPQMGVFPQISKG